MWFEIHCHTSFSDGKDSPETMIRQAKKIGLDGIVITDHDEIKGALMVSGMDSPDFRVYPGIEVSSLDGHILGINISEKIKKHMTAQHTVDKIHELGGIAIAAHPYDRYRKGVGDLIFTVDFDAVEVFNGHTFGNTRNPLKATQDCLKCAVGGSDAHTINEVGGVRIKVEHDLIEDILKGKVEILRKNPYKLFVNHGIGIVKRRIDKHVVSKIRKS